MAAKKKPLGDININILNNASGARKRSNDKKGDKIPELCKNEIKNILEPSTFKTRSKSTSCLNKENNFEVFEEEIAGNTEGRNKKIKKDKENVKTVLKRSKIPLPGKENAKNNLPVEREWKIEPVTVIKTCLDSKPKDSNILENNHEAGPRISNPVPVIPAETFKQVSSDLEKKGQEALKAIIFKEGSNSNGNTLKQRRLITAKRPKMTKNKEKKAYPQCDIFNEGILEDVMKTAFAQEKLILLPKNFIFSYHPNGNCRKLIIKFMFSLQEKFVLSHSEIYIALSLLDQVLSRAHVPNSIHELVGFTCIWISNKFIGLDEIVFDDDVLCVKRVEIPDMKYNSSDFRDMERKILKLIDFRIPSLEPSIFINYFLKKLDLDPTSAKYLTIFYVMDNAVLLDNYSATPLSIVAATSILLAFKKFHKCHLKKAIRFFKENLMPLEAFESLIIQTEVVKQMNSRDNEIVLQRYSGIQFVKE